MPAIQWHSVFFLLMALVACWFAVAVVLTSNVVRMAFYLVFSLAGVAGLFFLAGADFVGAMQLMIYVGGTLVLLAFGVMLTARGPFVSMQTGGGQWILAVLLGGSLIAVLLQAALSVKDWTSPAIVATAGEGRAASHSASQAESSDAAQPGNEVASSAVAPPTATPIGLALLGVRSDLENQPNATLRQGMSGYLLPFEIISVHLVVVLIGAAYLARAKGRRAKNPPAANPQS